MSRKKQVRNLLVHIIPCAATAVLAITVTFALIVALSESAPAQSGVFYNFTGQADGAYPSSGLTPAGEGTFYGTTCGQVCGSGTNSNGTVFKLAKQGSGWVLTTLYSFQGGSDGSAPIARVILGPGGTLYGTTLTGGIDGGCYFWLSQPGCGTVFKLSPPNRVAPNALGGGQESAGTAWTESVLYRFTGGADGGNPFTGDLIFDKAGNLYGTAAIGGSNLGGVVYKLTPTSGGWTETVLYSFGADGQGNPLGGVIFDGSGNLYGSEFFGGGCGDLCGAVFQLTPSGSNWTENVLYSFQGTGDGANPVGGVTFDQNGNLYGTTSEDTADIYNYVGGTLFMLNGTGGWNFSLLDHFTGGGDMWNSVAGPWTSLTAADGASGHMNFYGTTVADGSYGSGSIFSWTYNSSWGWEYNTLWTFGQGQKDGAYPISGVAFNANDGYAYVTTQSGGTNNMGTVFRATY